MITKLTLKEYLAKVIQHKIRVRTVVTGDGKTVYRATIRNTDNFSVADDPVDAVALLISKDVATS